MFQSVRMNKIQALVLDEQKDTVVKKLHHLGAVQITAIQIVVHGSVNRNGSLFWKHRLPVHC